MVVQFDDMSACNSKYLFLLTSFKAKSTIRKIVRFEFFKEERDFLKNTTFLKRFGTSVGFTRETKIFESCLIILISLVSGPN